MKSRKLQFLALVVLMSLFSWTTVHAQITPLGDSYTNRAEPTTNYGADAMLHVNGAAETTYIQFNLASIPPGAAVSQATLKLYVNGVATPGSFNVDYVNGAWSESTISSELAPALGGTIVSNVSVTAEDKNQYLLINVTPAVQAWLNGSEVNNGIALVANGAFNASFDSKENTATGHSPELDVVLATAGKLQWNGSELVCVQAPAAQGGIKSDGVPGSGSANIVSCGGGGGGGGGGSSSPITGVTAGLGLTGGGTSGNVTLGINTSVVPQLNAANIFAGNQTVDGNLSATGVVTGSGFQIGSNLFAFGTYVNGNAFLGFAGNSTTTGADDTAVGESALAALTTANFDTAVGMQALSANTSGGWNTATGFNALKANVSGGNNTANGANSLAANTTASYNTASGSSALYTDTTGGSNTANGFQTLYSNTTGSSNTAMGATAGQTADGSNLTGSNNSFLGANSALSTGTLSNAAAIGANAEVAESNALVLGSINGVNNATANTNVGIGTTTPQYALDVHGTGNFTGLVTFASGQAFPGTGPGTITGVTAGSGLSGGGSSGAVTLTNTGVLSIGAGTGISVGSGQAPTISNTGILAVAGGTGILVGSGQAPTISVNTTQVPLLSSGNLSLSTGNSYQIGGVPFAFGSYANNNAFLGFAGNSTMTGDGNAATGYEALFSNETGKQNEASGYQPLYSNTLGSFNTADGTQALYANSTGYFNTADGGGALYANTTGNYNTAIGVSAGYTVDLTDMTGSNNTFVGAVAYASTGTLSNATAIGAFAEVSESNALVLGSISGVNGATSNTNVGIGTTAPAHIFTIAQGFGDAYADGWSTYSSRRWKTNIETLHGALGKVEQLRGVSCDLKDSGKHEIGVIAEEVGQVVPEVVSYEKNGKDAQGVDYSRLTALLIEAVKQQQQQIQKQQRQIARLTGKVGALEVALRTASQREKSLSKVRSSAVAAETAELKPGHAMAR